MLRYDFRGGYRTQFSMDNLFDANTGTDSAGGTANGGFAAANYGAAKPGALPTYGATPTSRFSIPPRTFRLQMELHFGSAAGTRE